MNVVLTLEEAKEISDALNFYADGKHIAWVTFDKRYREAQLSRLKNDGSFNQIADDNRGHEQFIENGSKAYSVLDNLMNKIYDAENPDEVVL